MKHRKLIIGLVSFMLIIGLLVYNALAINPHKLTIREEILTSNKIDDYLDGLTIAYFTDLHYGNFTLDEDLDKCVTTINSIKPDIILFGGDLIDHYAINRMGNGNKDILIEKLSSLDAKIGKFAVLGNHDLASEDAKVTISSILETAGFSIITNANRQIFNGGNSCINLIGIDSLANGSPNVSLAYDGISEGAYTLVLSHCPDVFDDLRANSTDYVLAGHSHGGQVYIPIFNRFYRPYGCIKYFTGKHRSGNAILDISNGVGLTNKSIRLFADAEVVFYKLKTK